MHKLLKISAATLVAFAGAAFAAEDIDYGREPDKEAKAEHVKKWCHHWRERRSEAGEEEKYRKVKEAYERRCRKYEGDKDDRKEEGKDHDKK
jgi:glutathione S-transferase